MILLASLMHVHGTAVCQQSPPKPGLCQQGAPQTPAFMSMLIPASCYHILRTLPGLCLIGTISCLHSYAYTSELEPTPYLPKSPTQHHAEAYPSRVARKAIRARRTGTAGPAASAGPRPACPRRRRPARRTPACACAPAAPGCGPPPCLRMQVMQRRLLVCRVPPTLASTTCMQAPVCGESHACSGRASWWPEQDPPSSQLRRLMVACKQPAQGN